MHSADFTKNHSQNLESFNQILFALSALANSAALLDPLNPLHLIYQLVLFYTPLLFFILKAQFSPFPSQIIFLIFYNLDLCFYHKSDHRNHFHRHFLSLLKKHYEEFLVFQDFPSTNFFHEEANLLPKVKILDLNLFFLLYFQIC